MSRTLAGVLTGLFLLTVAGGAMAGIPDPDASQVTLTNATGAGMATCPTLDGPNYKYIRIDAKRADLSPIAGIPSTSFFFTVTGADVNITVDPLWNGGVPETDGSGQIQFIVDDNECYVGDLTIEVQIYTVALNDSDILHCNCFDINGDGGVGAQDFTLFVGDYGSAATRSDFNWDGGVGAQDFTLFVAHYGH